MANLHTHQLEQLLNNQDFLFFKVRLNSIQLQY